MVTKCKHFKNGECTSDDADCPEYEGEKYICEVVTIEDEIATELDIEF